MFRLKNRAQLFAILAIVLRASCADAQITAGNGVRQAFALPPAEQLEAAMDEWSLRNEPQHPHSSLDTPSDTVSKLDLKAPGAARREYDKGVALLLKKDFGGAVERLTKSITIYPSFVAAHNALGSVYMQLGRNNEARGEFARAVSLDDHLPYSHLNLGRAQLALNNDAEAEQSMQKASALAPLDLRLLTALAYTQFLNRNFAGAIATAQQVHSRKHASAAIVHYFAAASWQAQNKFPEMENELQTFLTEDPNSSVAETARGMIAQIEYRNQHPSTPENIAFVATPSDPNAPPPALAGRKVLQDLEERRQIAEVESECESCPRPVSPELANPAASSGVLSAANTNPLLSASPWTLHSSVDEVALFFAATDHGRSVTDLSQREVGIRDNGKPPASVLSFRNESQLPLRLGLVIDTSSSITRQFTFEQQAAASFLQKVMTGPSDLAFVVGFANSILLVQDFTSDQAKISHSLNQLAPLGGTSLWDAVKFAADKLASQKEQTPVARMLVVISDGGDNSSGATLKQAIESAERGEVIVYTVSTTRYSGDDDDLTVGDRALKTLAARTGGAAFVPDSLHGLNGRLADLQQVIRSRYRISYKPAEFKVDGKYRSIDVTAEKDGHKLRIYTRRGYYASSKAAD